MRVKVKVFMVLTGMLGMMLLPARGEALVFINEFLADPPPGLSGDANQDGVRNSSEDEFIELFNASAYDVNISGWYVTDSANAGTVRHVFAGGTVIASHHPFVVFGGGLENLFPENWVTASQGGLSLNNGGDTITICNDLGQTVDFYTYGSEAGDSQSIVREQEGSQGGWIKHTELLGANGRLFSPGYLVNDIDSRHQSTVPEPASAWLIASVLFPLGLKRFLG